MSMWSSPTFQPQEVKTPSTAHSASRPVFCDFGRFILAPQLEGRLASANAAGVMTRLSPVFVNGRAPMTRLPARWCPRRLGHRFRRYAKATDRARPQPGDQARERPSRIVSEIEMHVTYKERTRYSPGASSTLEDFSYEQW